MSNKQLSRKGKKSLEPELENPDPEYYLQKLAEFGEIKVEPSDERIRKMNIMSNGGAHVPAFLAKLWKIVDDPSTNDLICWSEHGNSFIIHNQSEFARDLLPLYYKHNNMASFVRQLNMYGFHKVVSVEHGGLRVEKDEMEFAHPYFLMGNEDSLEFIKRKVSSAKYDEGGHKTETYNKMFKDVQNVKGRQENMEGKLIQLRRENEALWSELGSLRQKHQKQQQIVSKLIQFLASMMSTQSRRIGVGGFKRPLPLPMLSDADDVKEAKVARSTPQKSRNTCAVIQDVTEVDDEPVVVLADQPVPVADDPNLLVTEIFDGQNQPQVEQLDQTQNVVETNETNLKPFDGNLVLNTAQDQTNQTIIAPPAPDAKLYVTEELDGHLGQTQTTLDNLRDLLMGNGFANQYNFDPSVLNGVSSSTLRSLFSVDGDGTNNEEEKKETSKGLTTPDADLGLGNELTTYNPCLFELAEDDAHFFEDPSSNMFLDAELENMMTTEKSKLIGSTGGGI